MQNLPLVSTPENLTNVNGTLYFCAPQQLAPSFFVRTSWKSDGTSAGTVNIIGPTLALPIVDGPFAVLNGSIIFAAYTSIDNVELWTSDGTTAGTVLLKEINTSSGPAPGSNPAHFLKIGTRVYFSAFEPTTELELWKTDGTTAGTVLVRDVLPSGSGGVLDSLVDLNGTVHYAHHQFLRKSDGTFSGTVLVKLVAPKSLVVGGNKIYFNGDGELWVSDGTTAGTVQVVDLTDPAIPNNHIPPTNISLSTPTVPEGPPANRSVGFLVSTDPESGDTFTYSLVPGTGGDDNGSFEIIGNQVRKTVIFDFESKNSYTIRVRSTDQWGAAFEKVFIISVSDVNDRPSIAVDPATTSVPETSIAPLTVGNIVITDDALGVNQLSLSGLDAGVFEIVGNTLQLKTGVALDYESGKTSYAVTVNVDDPAFTGIESSFDLVLAVTDADEFDVTAPVDNDVAANAVTENASNGTAVGTTALATDLDGTNNTVTYSLTNNAGGRFTINANSGVVTVADGSLLDFESATLHSITVQAASSDGSTSTQSFTIAVSDVDEFNVTPVVDSNSAPNFVAENVANGHIVTGLAPVASDADGTSNAITWSLTENAGGRFAIDPAAGFVTVLDAALLNYEAATSHTITVRATSQDNSFSEQSFVIQVTDVDEFNVGPITDTNAAVSTIPEHSPNGTPVGITAFAQDLDGSNNQITYSLWNTRAGRFAIDPVTGVVTVANGAILDREVQGTWTITVLATSQDGSISVKEFTVDLADVNEFKVGKVFDLNSAPDTIVENAPNGTLVGITGFGIDLDATNSAVTYSLWNTRGGRFAINPTTGVVTVANGVILDREVQGTWTITVLATSQDGSISVKDFRDSGLRRRFRRDSFIPQQVDQQWHGNADRNEDRDPQRLILDAPIHGQLRRVLQQHGLGFGIIRVCRPGLSSNGEIPGISGPAVGHVQSGREATHREIECDCSAPERAPTCGEPPDGQPAKGQTSQSDKSDAHAADREPARGDRAKAE